VSSENKERQPCVEGPRGQHLSASYTQCISSMSLENWDSHVCLNAASFGTRNQQVSHQGDVTASSHLQAGPLAGRTGRLQPGTIVGSGSSCRWCAAVAPMLTMAGCWGGCTKGQARLCWGHLRRPPDPSCDAMCLLGANMLAAGCPSWITPCEYTVSDCEWQYMQISLRSGKSGFTGKLPKGTCRSAQHSWQHLLKQRSHATPHLHSSRATTMMWCSSTGGAIT